MEYIVVLGISARDIVKAATDPRAQTLVATAAQAYAPEQTKKITAATSQALQHYRQARAILQQPRRPGGPPPQMMPMPQMDADGMPPVAPVQKSNILTFGIIGGAALVVLLMLRK